MAAISSRYQVPVSWASRSAPRFGCSGNQLLDASITCLPRSQGWEDFALRFASGHPATLWAIY